MAASVLPLLPDGETGVERVLHAADRALSTAETAVSASSAAAVRAARVDAAGVEAMAVGWLRSLEVPMRVSVLPLLPDHGETGVDSVLHDAEGAPSTAATAVSACSAAAVRAVRVDVTDVECRDMAVGWLRSLEVPMRVSVLPLLPDGETGIYQKRAT